LQQFFTAGLVAAVGEDDGGNVWKTLTGLLLFQGLQLLGLLAAGTLVGAGQRRAVLYGALVGVWNGILFILVHARTSDKFSAVTLYGQPLLQMAFGAAGGFLGLLIWPPPPALDEPFRRARKAARPQAKVPSPFDGTIAWWRVLAGAGVAIAGALWATAILEFVLEAGKGKISVTDNIQDRLVTFEITALIMLVGAAFAGATRANGLKQGLIVGLITAAILLGLKIGSGKFHLEWAVIDALTTVAVTLGGGWFGGQLFPPLLPVRPRGIGPEA
jgi:hypothetical protein